MGVRKALRWLGFWMALALLFCAGIYLFPHIFPNVFPNMDGHKKALEFIGGYVIELSLSMDNLFLFLMIFGAFGIPPKYQRRVLNYGIIGAVILRLIFIVLGVTVVNMFHWILYVFGVILIISGIKMFFDKEEEKDFSESKLLKVLGKMIPISDHLEDEKFFTRRNHILYATPLLAILVLIEGSDIVFAIDSIPAIFSITTDPFIVYTSNIFAILGLRSFYFILERLHRAFRFVKYGVAVILMFTGAKLGLLFFKIEIPLVTSLLAIFGILAISVLASLIFKEDMPTEG
jgi:tellurite resistance protein TerC